MRKIATLCMATALALAVTACSDDNDNDGDNGQRGTITIGSETEEVESAFSAAIPTQEGNEGGYYILLFEEDFKDIPKNQPNFYISLFIPESCFGKQIDLTKVLPKNGALSSFLIIGNKTHEIEISNTNIYVDPESLTLSSGTLNATRNGGKFAVKFTVTLSNGHTIAADWSGTPKNAAAPID